LRVHRCRLTAGCGWSHRRRSRSAVSRPPAATPQTRARPSPPGSARSALGHKSLPRRWDVPVLGAQQVPRRYGSPPGRARGRGGRVVRAKRIRMELLRKPLEDWPECRVCRCGRCGRSCGSCTGRGCRVLGCGNVRVVRICAGSGLLPWSSGRSTSWAGWRWWIRVPRTGELWEAKLVASVDDHSQVLCAGQGGRSGHQSGGVCRIRRGAGAASVRAGGVVRQDLPPQRDHPPADPAGVTEPDRESGEVPRHVPPRVPRLVQTLQLTFAGR
jgi:hypothetical protein